jgi:hypothetical protein
MQMTPFEAYKKFLALKSHFTSSYDYFKYQGKVSATSNAFETRKDKYHFYKLSKHKDPEKYLLSNFVEKDLKWVGDLFGEESEQVYMDWLKRQESLTYVFSNDIKKLLTNFDDNIIIRDGQHPPLLKMFLRKQISIETLIILNDIFNFFPHWNKKIEDTIIWPSIYNKCLKYKPFIQYNVFKCKKILKETFN